MVEITKAWIKAKLIKHFLPLGLALALLISLSWPYPGEKVSSWKSGDYRIVQTFNVCTIFFVSGMTVKTEDIHAAIKAWPSLLYGLVMLLLATPLLGFLTIEIPFSPREFSYGLTLFVCVPTTLTSGVSMVANAKGNTVLALFLTVGSNLLGVLTVPFMLKAVMSEADVQLDAAQLLLKLILTIFLPLCVGKAFRESFSPVPAFCTKNKTLLSMTNNGSLVIIVWQTCSRSADQILDQSIVSILPVLAAGIILHLFFLSVNYVGTEILSKLGVMEWRERMAVWLLASQKTLPVSMTILTYLSESDVGDHGLVAIPMIIGHMSQLFIDSYISSKWGAEEAARQEAEKMKSKMQDPEDQISNDGGSKVALNPLRGASTEL